MGVIDVTSKLLISGLSSSKLQMLQESCSLPQNRQGVSDFRVVSGLISGLAVSRGKGCRSMHPVLLHWSQKLPHDPITCVADFTAESTRKFFNFSDIAAKIFGRK